MINITDKTKCCGCSACYSSCPVNAISMQIDDKGFRYPVIEKDNCIDCGKCEKVCPILNRNENDSDYQLAYACFSKDEKTQLSSSSGGVFSELAKVVLKNNGIVFGASFNDEYLVEHICIKSVDDLYRLRGSKYLQSNINQSYKKVKTNLDENKLVYFSGTPCQVEGLLAFLGKNYDNLITQDIICHGVPSPKVWRYYLNQTTDVSNIKSINFRNKDNGWYNYNLKISAGTDIVETPNMYLKGFVNNLYLRSSCYECSFKSKERNSDVTLADYWGCDSVHSDMYNENGTSLIIIHSDKGKRLFDSINDEVVFEQTDFKKAIEMNPSMYVSSTQNKKSETFFDKFEGEDFNGFVDELLKSSVLIKVKNKVKSFIYLPIRILKKVTRINRAINQ